MGIRSIDTIDWAQLWQDELQRSNNRISPPDWDKLAQDFERQYSRSDYRDKLLKKIYIESGDTVLDIGCGPGNLAVPLAARAKLVTALDISGEMLRLAGQEAAREGLDNIVFVRNDWEDVVIGRDIQIHDVAVCSRSFSSRNPGAALAKLHQAAAKYVYLTLHTHADEATEFRRSIYGEMGREYRPSPDYIYAYNLLYQMGITAHVNFIDYTDSFRYRNAEDAYRILSSHMHPATPWQKEKLMLYITRNMEENNGFKLDLKCKWALLWWQK